MLKLGLQDSKGKPMTCIHCGAELGSGYRLNPWLVAYECRPKCEAGEAWYAENTMQTVGGRMLDSRREEAVREQRQAL